MVNDIRSSHFTLGLGPNYLGKDETKINSIEQEVVQRNHEMQMTKPKMDADEKVIPKPKVQNFNIKHRGAGDTYGYLSTAQRFHNDSSTFGHSQEDLKQLIDTKQKSKLLQKQLKASNVCLSMRPSNYPF